jgi:hypothetical protein
MSFDTEERKMVVLDICFRTSCDGKTGLLTGHIHAENQR